MTEPLPDKKPVALVIEDEGDYQYMLRAALKKEGFSVVAVKNVADAAKHLGLEYVFDPKSNDLRLQKSPDYTLPHSPVDIIISDQDLVSEGMDYGMLKTRIPALAYLKNAKAMLSFTTGGAFIDRLDVSAREGFLPVAMLPPVVVHCGNPEDMLANGRPDCVKDIVPKTFGDDEEEKETNAIELAKAAAEIMRSRVQQAQHDGGLVANNKNEIKR